MAGSFSLPWRLLMLVVYIFILGGINSLLFGEPVPSESKLLVSFVSYLFAILVLQPHFTDLKDSLSNASAAVFVIVPLIFGSDSIRDASRTYWLYALVASFVVLGVTAAVTLLDKSGWQNRLGKLLYFLSSRLGSPKVQFTILHFLILNSFYPEKDDIIWLSLAWIFVVFGQPVEVLFGFVRHALGIWRGFRRKAQVIGKVVSRHHPRLLTIRVAGEEHPDVASLVIVPITNSSCQVGVVLDNYRLAEELWTKALILKDVVPPIGMPEIDGPTNVALKCDEEIEKQLMGADYKDFLSNASKIIGAVTEKSDINRVRIELYCDCLTISEGQLMSVKIGGQDVLYQVTNGVTESEELVKLNRHGYMQIEARKLGVWNERKERFEQVHWTPPIYSPISIVKSRNFVFRKECIGHFPKSDFGISVNCNELVTHNTAILGVLGSGKTSLAAELIRRMSTKGIKVWIIDITHEYEKILGDLIDCSKQDDSDDRIVIEMKKYRPDAAEDDMESGGNHNDFANIMFNHIEQFINDKEWKVRIFDPNNFLVTEQSSYKDFKSRQAGFRELTPVQITRIVAEQILACLRKELTDEAQICLVLA